MRPFESCRVTNLDGIKHGNVGLHSRTQQSAIAKPQPWCRKRRHLAHRVFESDRVTLTNVNAEDSNKGAVASRVRMCLAEDRDLTIRSDHRRRVFQNSLEICFIDRVEDPAGAAAFDDPQSCL